MHSHICAYYTPGFIELLFCGSIQLKLIVQILFQFLKLFGGGETKQRQLNRKQIGTRCESVGTININSLHTHTHIHGIQSYGWSIRLEKGKVEEVAPFRLPLYVNTISLIYVFMAVVHQITRNRQKARHNFYESQTNPRKLKLAHMFSKSAYNRNPKNRFPQLFINQALNICLGIRFFSV